MDANRQMVSYQYNANGQPIRVLLPDGRAVDRTYTDLGKVETVRDGDETLSTFSYLVGGQMSEIDLGAVKQLPLTWDGTLGLLEHVRLVPLPTVDLETYTPVDSAYPTAFPLDVTWQQGFASHNSTLTARSDMRLLTELHDHVIGGTSVYFEKTYGYDPTGNLTSQLNELTTPDQFTQQYYNRANFLTGFQTDEVPVDPATFAANPHNVLTDRNGNIKRIVKNLDFTESPDTFTWDFSFDAENRLIEARGFNTDTDQTTILEFGYDGLGRRVITRENGVGHWYVYDGDQLVQDRGERSDELLVEYTYGPTPTGPAAIFKQNRGGQERFFYTSPQGGFPRYAFDDTGALTDWLQYSAFGELVFHEASGTPTEIGIGAGRRWNIAMDTPLPLAFQFRGASVNIPALTITLSKPSGQAKPMHVRRTQCGNSSGASGNMPLMQPLEALTNYQTNGDEGELPQPSPGDLDPGLNPRRRSGVNDCCFGPALETHGSPPPTKPDCPGWTGALYDPRRKPPKAPTHPPVLRPPAPDPGPSDPSEESLCLRDLRNSMGRAMSAAISMTMSGCVKAGSPLSDCLKSVWQPLQNGVGFRSELVNIRCSRTCRSGEMGCTECSTSPTPTIHICLPERTGFPLDSVIIHELLHACMCLARPSYAQFDDHVYEDAQACLQAKCVGACVNDVPPHWPSNWGGDHQISCEFLHGTTGRGGGTVEAACPRLFVNCGEVRCAGYPNH